MFSFIQKKFKKHHMYDDVSTVYDIVEIKDNYLLIKYKNVLKQLHIYKIEPVTIVNVTESNCNEVIDIYTEFLRSMNYDFQIYIENTKINLNNYFNNITLDNKNINKNKLASIYKKELENMLDENSVYIYNYYIVLALDNENEIDEISKNIYNLCKIGILAQKMIGKDVLDKFIYEKANKVEYI